MDVILHLNRFKEAAKYDDLQSHNMEVMKNACRTHKQELSLNPVFCPVTLTVHWYPVLLAQEYDMHRAT